MCFISIVKEGKHFGRRVTDVDAETDRMARLFLGKEDEEEARRRLKIVQVRSRVNRFFSRSCSEG